MSVNANISIKNGILYMTNAAEMGRNSGRNWKKCG